MFGWQPHLPVDLAFGVNDENSKQPSTKYIDDMQEGLSKAYDLATSSTQTAQSRQNKDLQPGDRDLSKWSPLKISKFYYLWPFSGMLSKLLKWRAELCIFYRKMKE